MIIDSHLHADLSGYDPQKLIRYLDNNGIDRGWLLSWEETNPEIPEYHHLSPERILEICTAYPDRFLPFYAPDPCSPELEKQLRWFSEQGFRGFGELKVSSQWDDPLLVSYLERIRRIRPLLIFHMEKPGTLFSFSSRSIENRVNYGSNGLLAYLLGKFSRATRILRSHRREFPGYLMNMEKLDATLELFPDISFVAHGPEFWRQYGQQPPQHAYHAKGRIRNKGVIWQMLEKHGNLYCDISGYSAFNALSRDISLSAEFLHNFNRKILFGTDNTNLQLTGLLKKIGLETSVERNIMGENAIRLIE